MYIYIYIYIYIKWVESQTVVQGRPAFHLDIFCLSNFNRLALKALTVIPNIGLLFTLTYFAFLTLTLPAAVHVQLFLDSASSDLSVQSSHNLICCIFRAAV